MISSFAKVEGSKNQSCRNESVIWEGRCDERDNWLVFVKKKERVL